MTTNTSVCLQSVTKSFGSPGRKVYAVRGTNLDITPGEVVVPLGPNCVGKPWVLGDPPSKAVHRGEISVVFQSGGLLADFRVSETLRAFGVCLGSAKTALNR